MKLRSFTTGLAMACLGSTAFSHDLSGVKTRVLSELEGPSQPRDISNKVLGNTALASEGIANLSGRHLRTRFWTIRDQGIVPIHDHTNRPAVFTVLTGEVFEYSSKESDRILHQTDGVALEEGGSAHWWLNESGEDVYLIAFDVFEPTKGVTEVTRPQSMAYDMPDPVGVKHELLGTVNMGKHFGDGTGEGWVLSTYRTTIDQGGVFPSFVASGEPLHSFVWKGEVIEHRGDAQTKLETHAGSAVDGGQVVWWKNIGPDQAIMYFGAVEPATEVKGLPRVGGLARGSHSE